MQSPDEDIGMAVASSIGEVYAYRGEEIVHEISLGVVELRSATSCSERTKDIKGAWWSNYLAGHAPAALVRLNGALRVADLFCGSGGLANGVRQLCAELGISMISEFIADEDEEATRVYAANHPTRLRSSKPVQSLIDYSIRGVGKDARFAYHPEIIDPELNDAVHGVDLVLAGPPCQGHSNLNNRTRRSDPRNSLYLTVPAFAVAVGARMCIVENVPAVLNDHSDVVTDAIRLLENEGYQVTSGVLSAADMGWPQTRKRHFLVARKDGAPVPLSEVAECLRDDITRSLWWAIGHLEDAVGGHVLDQVSSLSEENKARIDWLFDNDEYDLALRERPESHRSGTTYTSVYGRLRKDLPSPTITTGFMTPGRGRFTHPTRRRVLTPREAARIQGFPDTYCFAPDPANPPPRKLLAKWIGDAVPMPLGYAAALSAMAGAPTVGTS